MQCILYKKRLTGAFASPVRINKYKMGACRGKFFCFWEPEKNTNFFLSSTSLITNFKIYFYLTGIIFLNLNF